MRFTIIYYNDNNYCVTEIYSNSHITLYVSYVFSSITLIYCKFNICICFEPKMFVFFKVFRMINGLKCVAFHNTYKTIFLSSEIGFFSLTQAFFSRVPKTIIVIFWYSLRRMYTHDTF